MSSLGWRHIWLGVLVVLGVTIALFAPPATARSTASVAATTPGQLSGPGLHYCVTGQLERGQRIRAYEPVRGTWVKVCFAAGEAYLARQYLTTSVTLAIHPDQRRWHQDHQARLNLRSAPATSGGIVGGLADLPGRAASKVVQHVPVDSCRTPGRSARAEGRGSPGVGGGVG